VVSGLHARTLFEVEGPGGAVELGGACGARGRRARARAQAVLAEGAGGRAQPFRPFGMAGRRLVFKKNFIEAERGSQSGCILGSLASVRKTSGIALLAMAAAALLYGLCAPAVPNGDGMGYLRAARDGALVPGHPAFVPLLR